MVYSPSSLFGSWTASANYLVASTATEFESLVTANQDSPDFAGTLILTDDPEVGTWPPTSKGIFHLRVRVTDVAYYNDTWVPQIATGWKPGFLEDDVVDPAPSAANSIMVFDTWEVLAEGVAKFSRVRIAKIDGAAGVVFSRLEVDGDLLTPEAIEANGGIPIPEPAVGSCGGRFRRGGFCCFTQAFLCQITSKLGCKLPNGVTCGSCVADCRDCVSNPCHSCDPCGGTGFFACVLRIIGKC